MSSGEVQVGRDAVCRLQKLGVDVSQLADVPIPDELWPVIERVVRGVRGQDQRWYAAAAMYGRFVAELKAGRSANELIEQYAAGRSLGPILQHPEMRELVLAENLSGPLNRWLADVIRRTGLRPGEKLDVAVNLVEKIHEGLSAGESVAEITVWLGKPRQVARRMRRAMIKRRSWLSRVFRRSCQLAATLVLLLA
ncbi:MAG: hypothetical protein HY290_24310, partial [Planctomycetia bacterium]|nr:hypothetical protein [Planctomycetia bacterium]